jgi:hypothetical protein
MNCASTVLALHVENVLQKSTSAHERQMARTRIHSELSYLRSLPSSWIAIKWTLRMFEVVVSRTGLSLEVAKESDFNLRSENPFNFNIQNNNRLSVENGGDNSGTFDFLGSSDFNFDMPALELDDNFGPMMGINSDDWLHELLGTNFASLPTNMEMSA